MTFTLSLGWWLAPLLVTVSMVGWVTIASATDRPTGGDYCFNLYPLFRMAVALPVSLTAWLIWALLT